MHPFRGSAKKLAQAATKPSMTAHTHIRDTGIKSGTHDFSSPLSNPYSIESANLAHARRMNEQRKPLVIQPTAEQARRIAEGRHQRTSGTLPWPTHGGPR